MTTMVQRKGRCQELDFQEQKLASLFSRVCLVCSLVSLFGFYFSRKTRHVREGVP